MDTYQEIYQAAFKNELQKIAKEEKTVPQAYGSYAKSVMPRLTIGSGMKHFVKKETGKDISKKEGKKLFTTEIYRPGLIKGFAGMGAGAAGGAGIGALISAIRRMGGKYVLPGAVIGGLGLGTITSAMGAAKGTHQIATGKVPIKEEK